MAIIAAKHAKEVVGIDVSPSAIELAQMNAKKHKLTNSSFENKDAVATSFPEGKFTFVISHYTFARQLQEMRRRILRESLRLLPAGGRLGFFVYTQERVETAWDDQSWRKEVTDTGFVVDGIVVPTTIHMGVDGNCWRQPYFDSKLITAHKQSVSSAAIEDSVRAVAEILTTDNTGTAGKAAFVVHQRPGTFATLLCVTAQAAGMATESIVLNSSQISQFVDFMAQVSGYYSQEGSNVIVTVVLQREFSLGQLAAIFEAARAAAMRTTKEWRILIGLGIISDQESVYQHFQTIQTSNFQDSPVSVGAIAFATNFIGENVFDFSNETSSPSVQKLIEQLLAEAGLADREGLLTDRHTDEVIDLLNQGLRFAFRLNSGQLEVVAVSKFTGSSPNQTLRNKAPPKGKDIVYGITGGTGAIGSQLIRYLLTLPDTEAIYVLTRQRDEFPLLKLAASHHKVIIIQGDLKDIAALSQLVSASDVILHLGAWTGLTELAEEEAALTNIMASAAIFELASREYKRVVFTSTFHLYYLLGEKTEGTLNEADLLLSDNAIMAAGSQAATVKTIIRSSVDVGLSRGF